MAEETHDPILPLAVELVMRATVGDLDESFVSDVHQRLDETLTSQEDAYELIVCLATFSGITVSEWADATDRNPSEIMQGIGLDIASAMYTDDDS